MRLRSQGDSRSPRRRAQRRAHLAAYIASAAAISHAEAVVAIHAIIAAITDAIQRGDRVVLAGVGVLKPKRMWSGRRRHIGRNVHTGEVVKVAAQKDVRFRASVLLLRKMNVKPKVEW